MKKQHVCRFGIYLLGMAFIALGIMLNTKAGLGASAIISVPYTVAQGTGLDFANLISMVGVGRVIYAFNYLALPKLQKVAGLSC